MEPNVAYRLRIGLIAASIVGITVLHDITPSSQTWWRTIIEQIYVLPVIVAAIYFGWRGGMAAVAFVTACYSHVFIAQSPHLHLVGQAAPFMNFVLAGLVAGILSDRERKNKLALQKTTRELGSVYRELQENFERMKRSERLYAIGQMSAGLAHEVRNPLASIEGAVEILKRDPHSAAKSEEFLEIIQKECRRLNRMLTNFLEFARPRPPHYQMTDVGQILDSVIALTTHTIAEKAVVLRKILPPNGPSLECDPEQLKQVILNLTINAIHAMPGGGEITLSARQQDEKVIIEVKDQGCGINPQHLDNIFDPFFTTKEDGTGLGLPVAHQIVGQHGGMLMAKNNADKGMTFSILLPLKYGRVL